MKLKQRQEEPEYRCNVCGGKLLVGWENKETVSDDGHCPGYCAVDKNGRVLGCGAWPVEAYQ